MESIKFYLPLIPAFFLLFSCGTGPKAETEQEVAVVQVEEPVSAVEEFNPSNVSREYYDLTKEEVQKFIGELNTIIRREDYAAWRNALSPEYFADISSPESLRQWSDTPTMRALRIVLRTPEDYFKHVVVPSRANSRVDDRVDDIEFVSRDRVKAYTVSVNRAGEEQRVRLYDLERFGDTWKIIN